MKKIGILSDTHNCLPQQVFTFFKDCDELWHAGDIGYNVLEPLREFKPVRAVWGNCDSLDLHIRLSEVEFFECEGCRVLMMHIGGWPGHYSPAVRRQLQLAKPDLFVCGHSHILKVMYDKEYNLLHINPGAAGRQGYHQVSTLVRLDIDDGKPSNVEIFEYPK